MVPGVDVARLDDSTYAISIRGFNQTFADKVLVLVDGRSVYSQTFSGVFWDQLDVPVEDIDRIEVIRGPGGTMWGANAVNGVINIITKKSFERETQGGRESEREHRDPKRSQPHAAADAVRRPIGRCRLLPDFRPIYEYRRLGYAHRPTSRRFARDAWRTADFEPI